MQTINTYLEFRFKILKKSLYMRYCLFILQVLFWTACGSEASSEKCKYGEPLAIFSEELEQIQSHSFQQNGQKAVEELLFADRTRLEIFQSGCNEIRQEFRFYLPAADTSLPDSLWFNMATDRMLFLGGLDSRYMSLGMTGQIIKENKAQMQLGQFQGMDFDSYIMVDRIAEPNNSMLIIVMEKRS